MPQAEDTLNAHQASLGARKPWQTPVVEDTSVAAVTEFGKAAFRSENGTSSGPS